MTFVALAMTLRRSASWSDEGVLLALAAATAGGLAEGRRDSAARVGDVAAGEELVDGQDLQAGVLLIGKVLGSVDAGGEGFLAHGLGGRLEGDEDADLGLLAVHVALEGGDHAAVDVAALDLDDDALGLAAVVVEEVDVAIDAGVGATAAVVGGTGVHEAQGPPLELIAVLLGEGGGAAGVGGLADDLVGAEGVAEAVVKAVADQGDGQVGDVDTDPAAVEALGGDGGGAAAAEGVEDDVALVAAGVDDALQQGLGLLGGVAEAFLCPSAYRVMSSHQSCNWYSGHFVKIPFVSRCA